MNPYPPSYEFLLPFSWRHSLFRSSCSRCSFVQRGFHVLHAGEAWWSAALCSPDGWHLFWQTNTLCQQLCFGPYGLCTTSGDTYHRDFVPASLRRFHTRIHFRSAPHHFALPPFDHPMATWVRLLVSLSTGWLPLLHRVHGNWEMVHPRRDLSGSRAPNVQLHVARIRRWRATVSIRCV